MEKIKLFVLAVNVWDADDYLNDRKPTRSTLTCIFSQQRREQNRKLRRWI